MASDTVKRKDIPVTFTGGDRSVAKPNDFGRALASIMESHTGRHWKTLIQTMGEMKVPMSALANLDEYAPEFSAMLKADEITLSELVLLQQYAKAIKEGDTKAATFLRDTAGMAPVREVSVSNEPTGLQSLSDEELKLLLKTILDVQVEGTAETVTEGEE